jgi:hypothetical protein
MYEKKKKFKKRGKIERNNPKQLKRKSWLASPSFQVRKINLEFKKFEKTLPLLFKYAEDV